MCKQKENEKHFVYLELNVHIELTTKKHRLSAKPSNKRGS